MAYSTGQKLTVIDRPLVLSGVRPKRVKQLLLGRLWKRCPVHRALHDRQVDRSRGETEGYRQPPDRRVAAVSFVEDPTQKHAEETTDLVGEEGKAVQHGPQFVPRQL